MIKEDLAVHKSPSIRQSISHDPRDKLPSFSEDNVEAEITAQITLQEEGKWGWLVVFAAFFNLFVLDGVAYTFGSILPDMIKDLQIPETPITFINSLSVALYFIASPLASALINRFGFRECSMIGSIICSFSLLIAQHVTKYAYLCLFYGVFAGFGYALINMSSGLVAGFYFEKLRSLAMAVTSCGSSFGIMAMFPLNSYLVNLAGWRSTVMLHSGMVGLVFFSGMTFRPLLSFTVTKTDAEPCSTRLSEAIPDTTTERIFGALGNSKFPTAADFVEEPVPQEAGPSNRPTSQIKFYSASRIALNSINPPGGISERHLRQLQSLRSQSPQLLAMEINVGSEPIVKRKKENWCKRFFHWEPHLPYSRPLYRDDVFYGGDLETLDAYKKISISPENLTGFEYQLAVTRTVAVKDLKDDKGIFTTAAKRVLATMLDPKLLSRPSCILLCSSGFMTYIGYFVPFVYLPDRNLKAGVAPEHCDLFISIIGFSNIIGKLVLGALASKVDPFKLFILWCTMSGVSTLLSGLSFSIYYQYLYCFIFGFSISSFSCLRGVILVSLYGLEKLTNVTGVVLIFLGLGNLISTPVASVLKNNYGYNVAFLFSGVFMACSGLIMIPVKAASVRESRQMNDEVKQTNDEVKQTNDEVKQTNDEVKQINDEVKKSEP